MTPVPSQHSPGYKSRWQQVRRKAIARLIELHEAEFKAIEAEIRELEHSAQTH